MTLLWQAAKISLAVLLCQMEQGEIGIWTETEKIDRIRRANAQRHVSGSFTNTGVQKLTKKVPSPCHACISMTIFVLSTNTMKQKGCFIGIFEALVSHRRARSVLIVQVIVKITKKRVTLGMVKKVHYSLIMSRKMSFIFPKIMLHLYI